MTITIQGPGGAVVQFPDGTPQSEIVSAMDAQFGTPKTSEPISATNVARSVAKGIPIVGGLLNKAEAATNAALAPYVDPLLPADYEKLPGETFGERYQQALDIQNRKDTEYQKEHPIASTAGEVAGGIAALVPAAATTTGAKLLGLTGKTLPSMAARGAASGAALSAADAATRGNDPLQAAEIGGITGAAAPVVARGIGAIVNKAIGAKPTVPTSDELKSAAEAGYNQLRSLDVKLKPTAISGLAQNLESDLQQSGVRDYLAPKTFSALSELKSPPSNSTIDFADIHGIRRVFGKIAGSPDPTERMAASRAISELDNYLTSIPPTDVLKGDATLASNVFNEAQANYAAMKRSGVLEGKIADAELQAASANSGQNIDNAMRQRIKDILKSKTLRRGYSQEELLQMQKIVRGTTPGNILRGVGNLLGGGGGIGALASAGSGVMAAGPAGAVAPALGYAVKKAGNALTAAQVSALDEMIRSRSPEAVKALAQSQLAVTKSARQRAQLERIIAAASRAASMPLTVPQQ